MQLPHKKIAIALLSLGFAAHALGQSPGFGPFPDRKGQAKSSTLAASDRAFIEKAATDGLAEVALGRFAQRQGSGDAVKKFGARMVQDHSKANDELSQLAGAKGLQLPAASDSKHQKEQAELAKKSGTRFDHEYMELMVSEHQKDVAEFRRQSESAKDPDVRKFAAKTLPTLEEHLKLAEAIKASLK
jgi:putative membrane protein